MKWNTPQSNLRVKTAYPQGGTGGVRRPYVVYKQKWDQNRAVVEALQKVTWVYRAVDAIASNAARVPLVLREDNQWDGTPVENSPLYKVLNSKTNAGEDSVAFRYRLSSQLLLSSKGVFIEVTRTRGGEVLALMLLPPDKVEVVPDETNFVKEYRLHRENSDPKVYKPDEIIWIRKPHPFDDYGAITPLEAAGVAIETDWLAKMYNRNFMLNDGRPGGIVVVKGDMTEDDKEELRAKFSGSVARAGRISVIASEEGADFVDTAVTPRDAQYTDARKLTKEEILMAFGVPETVISNASGRTFDNAEIERVIFWMETMVPHLDLIVRPMDILDSNENRYLGYDLSRVDVLQRMEAKRREFILREADAGALSFNEYREATGREKIDHPIADILWITNTKRPTVTTDGELPDESLAEKPTQPEGRPSDQSVGEQPEEDPVQREGDPRQAPLDNSPNTAPADQGVGQKALIVTKEEPGDAFAKAMWTEITETTLNRLVERSARVVSEKASGPKFRKAFFSEADNDAVADSIFDESVWVKQLHEDLLPVARGAVEAVGGDSEFSTVRGLSILALIEDTVKGVISEERSNPKPDMQTIAGRIKSELESLIDSDEIYSQAVDFASHYVSLGEQK